jgi:hypothetical protein
MVTFDTALCRKTQLGRPVPVISAMGDLIVELCGLWLLKLRRALVVGWVGHSFGVAGWMREGSVPG